MFQVFEDEVEAVPLLIFSVPLQVANEAAKIVTQLIRGMKARLRAYEAMFVGLSLTSRGKRLYWKRLRTFERRLTSGRAIEYGAAPPLNQIG